MSMESQDQVLSQIVKRVTETEQPDLMVLFGSRARGNARPSSDYDVLIIKDSKQPRYARSADLYVSLADLPVEVDVLVYTPDEVAEWSSVREAFVTTAIREGKVMYEKPR
jgi:predicted nucleotidyltransferase